MLVFPAKKQEGRGIGAWRPMVKILSPLNAPSCDNVIIDRDNNVPCRGARNACITRAFAPCPLAEVPINRLVALIPHERPSADRP